MQREITIRGMALADELNALRDKKIAEALPAQKGGTGVEGAWRIEAAS